MALLGSADGRVSFFSSAFSLLSISALRLLLDEVREYNATFDSLTLLLGVLQCFGYVTYYLWPWLRSLAF